MADKMFYNLAEVGEKLSMTEEQVKDLVRSGQLREFRDASGLSGTKARKLVNDVLSFLIHNGVLINPGMI